MTVIRAHSMRSHHSFHLLYQMGLTALPRKEKIGGKIGNVSIFFHLQDEQMEKEITFAGHRGKIEFKLRSFHFSLHYVC